MARRELTLINKRGLHARAATKLVQCCQQFDARVCVLHGERRADAANIMSLMMLAASCHTCLTVEAKGPEADRALEAITRLIESRFDEEC